jgi:predicted membrane protein
MTEQIHRAKINKPLCVFVLSFDLFFFALCICCVIWLVYLRSVYFFCHLTCLSSLCVFVLSFDLFIFALCICSVIWLAYLRSVYLVCHLTCYRTNTQTEDKQVEWQNKYTTKINKSNDRTNTQSEDKQVEWQNKYTERRKQVEWQTKYTEQR